MVLVQDDSDDLHAIRINVPLSHVSTVEKTDMLSFAGLITVTVDPNSSHGALNDPATEHPISSTEGKEDITLLDNTSVKQVLQLGVLRKGFDWKDVMTHVNNAKAEASKDNFGWPGSRVFIDVDPRTWESSEKSDNHLSDIVKSVSFALGLDTTKEAWCTSFFLSPLMALILFQLGRLIFIASL